MTWRFRETSNILQWVRFHYSIIISVAYLVCHVKFFHSLPMRIGRRNKKICSPLDGLGRYRPRRSPALQDLKI